MSDLSTLVGGPARSMRPVAARGRVARPPATLTSSLTVTLINYSPDYSFTVPASNWMQRGSTLPAAGDRCVVVFDDDGDAWVPAWEGVHSVNAVSSADLRRGLFSAYRNAAASLATGAVVVFDAEERDLSDSYDTATGRFTPQLAGYYRLSWLVYVSTALTADNYVATLLRKNGAVHKTGTWMNFRSDTVGTLSTGTANVQANGSTDYFDIRLDHGHSANVALVTGAAWTYFQGELIAPS